MAEVLDFRNPRVDRGRCAYLSGLAAEDSVVRHYERLGAEVVCQRFRGAGAEIDLIFRQRDLLVFVEVKAAATFEQAAQRVRWSQLHRIMQAAEAYGAQQGGFPPLMRIDVALVEGQGMVQILENVSMAA